MPKTKDAFALRDFDTKRILQRKYFKDFNLPVGDDEDVLRSFLNVLEKPIEGITPSGFLKIISPNEEGYLKGAIENIETVTRLVDRADCYANLRLRHILRLQNLKEVYIDKFISTDDKNYKNFFARIKNLINSYGNDICAIARLKDEISLKARTLQELFEKDFRQRFFGLRLRQARKTAGLTQAELAARVGLKSYNPVTQYERGINDPSLPTLFRLATTLNVKTDWLLGLN